MLKILKKIIPQRLFKRLQPGYHRFLVTVAAVFYGFPAKKLTVVGVTGTKGKSTTAELLAAILSATGNKVVISSTVHFKIADEEQPNLFKLTTPGRFFLQKLLAEAVKKGCTQAVIELSSEGAKLWRHIGLALDGLIVTNLSPEHIEAHGSFEKYRGAKLRLLEALIKSPKPNKFLVLNGADPELKPFKNLAGQKIRQAIFHSSAPRYATSLPGRFNLENALAAGTAAEMLGIEEKIIRQTLIDFSGVKGRLERVEAGQPFAVIIDYAHTADSLEKLYQVFAGKKLICVLGGTGGGRDSWKRPVMGRIADTYCAEIILTNEDPYDEDPRKIIQEVADGITKHPSTLILDRRQAITEAVKRAQPGDIVIISGKGTDPYIMGPDGQKTPWNDSQVAAEELKKILDHA